MESGFVRSTVPLRVSLVNLGRWLFFSFSLSLEVSKSSAIWYLNFIVGFCWANILYLISGDPFCIESKVFECLLEILRAKYALNISSIELIDGYLCLINYLGKMISLCSYFNKLRELEIHTKCKIIREKKKKSNFL